MSTPALSPIPITSRPVRARLDAVKAELSKDYRALLGRDATWNEVMIQLLDDHDTRTRAQEGKANDQDHG